MSEPRETARRWRRRKEARPGEIVAAALAEFSERGFAATRLDAVARRAGVSKGTLYLYFDSKEALFRAVVRAALVPNLAQAEAELARATGPTMDLIERVLSAMVGSVAGSPAAAIPRLILAEAGNFPEIARFYQREVVARGFALVKALLERGTAAGEFRSVDAGSTVVSVLAPFLLLAVWGQVFRRVAPRGLDPQAVVRAHLSLLRAGLAKEGTVP